MKVKFEITDGTCGFWIIYDMTEEYEDTSDNTEYWIEGTFEQDSWNDTIIDDLFEYLNSSDECPSFVYEPHGQLIVTTTFIKEESN